MPVNNEILGILSGRLTRPITFGENLAWTIVGVGLGALVELGKADEVILQRCEQIIAGVRRALQDPEALAGFVDLQNKFR